MSACSTCVWQMEGPRRRLRHYESVSALLFTMAVCILALGPLSLTIVNYGITFMFAVITIQQLCDKEDNVDKDVTEGADDEATEKEQNETQDRKPCEKEDADEEEIPKEKETQEDKPSNDCDECSESRIYSIFKNFRDKFTNLGEET